MIKADKIKLFRDVFKGRDDIVPKYWRSLKTGHSGYAPVCRYEWHRPECKKGIVDRACASCKHMSYKSLSDSLVWEHFKGIHILGVYPLMKDHSCYFIAADFDNHTGDRNPLDDIKAFYEICQVQDIPCYIVRSKSGNGFHAFIFFKFPVPAWKARAVCFALLREAEIIEGDTEISSFDRLFPNQDSLSGKGFGNLIALPFQGEAAKKGHTLFLKPPDFTNPFKNQWDTLAEIEKTDESALNEIMTDWNLEAPSDGIQGKINMPEYENSFHIDYPLSDFEWIADRCSFIAHCRRDAVNLPEPEWYVMLTISARCIDGERLSHKLSAPYPGYSYDETAAKINRALTCTGPYRCTTIKKINGKYCRQCMYQGIVKSPIVLGRASCRYYMPGYSGRGMSVKEAVRCFYSMKILQD